MTEKHKEQGTQKQNPETGPGTPIIRAATLPIDRTSSTNITHHQNAATGGDAEGSMVPTVRKSNTWAATDGKELARIHAAKSKLDALIKKSSLSSDDESQQDSTETNAGIKSPKRLRDPHGGDELADAFKRAKIDHGRSLTREDAEANQVKSRRLVVVKRQKNPDKEEKK